MKSKKLARSRASSLKRQKKDAAHQEQVNEALSLRRQDWSYAQIGEKLGVKSSIVAHWLYKAIALIPYENAGLVRVIEREKLDLREQEVRYVRNDAMRTLTDAAETRDKARKATGAERELLLVEASLVAANALLASKVILDADRTLGQIADRRAKLLGLDAPVVTELTGPGGTPLGATPEEAARLIREAFPTDVAAQKIAVDAHIIQDEDADGQPLPRELESNVVPLRGELRSGVAGAASSEVGDVPEDSAED